MTFNNTTRSRGEERRETVAENKSHHPEIIKEDNKKPDKFLDMAHEKRWELKDCKCKIIIRITKEDFIGEIEDYSHVMSEDYVMKNPITYGARVTGIKMKIFNATGIAPHKLDVVRVSISTKK